MYISTQNDVTITKIYKICKGVEVKEQGSGGLRVSFFWVDGICRGEEPPLIYSPTAALYVIIRQGGELRTGHGPLCPGKDFAQRWIAVFTHE